MRWVMWRGMACVLAVGWLPAAGVAGEGGPPEIQAKSAVLMDVSSGLVLYQKGAHDRRPVASTTKIMTALVALESADRNDWVTVSPNAPKVEPSMLGLKPGERVLLDYLLTGLLLKSANDAAIAIAEHVSGSVEAFAAKMNERAQALGATDTHFVNPHGLYDPNHYSSAYDLALITREALKIPRFRELVGMRAAEVFRPDTSGAEMVENHNKLLWRSDYVDGVKTGFVKEAGQCIVASATKPARPGDGWQLVAVLLDSPDKDTEALQLLDYGFSTFQQRVYARKGDVLDRAPVERGRDPEVPAVCAETLAGVVGPGLDKEPRLRVERRKLVAPVRKGEVVGEALLVVGDRVLRRSPLVAGASVSVARRWAAWMWAGGGVALLALAAITVRLSATAIKAHRRRRRRVSAQVRGPDPGGPSTP